MPHRITRASKSSKATRIPLELIYVMTLAHFHIRYPMCHCCLQDQMSFVYLEPFRQITFRILDLDLRMNFVLTFYMGLKFISLARWEWAIQVRRGQEVVYLLPLRSDSQTPMLNVLMQCYPSLLPLEIMFNGFIVMLYSLPHDSLKCCIYFILYILWADHTL